MTADPDVGELAALAEGVHWSLFRITASIRRHEYTNAEHRELTLTQCSILYRLSQQGPTRISDLAAQDGVTKATMAVSIGRLEASGMVTRRRDETDRRVFWVDLTDKGLTTQRAAVATFTEAMCDVLTASDLSALAEAAAPLRVLATLHDLDVRTAADDAAAS